MTSPPNTEDLPAARHSRLATAATVVGCVGLLIAPLAPVAIAIGILALMQDRRRPIANKGFAVGGIALGAATFVAAGIVWLLIASGRGV
jgi:hypothetical protein